MIKACASTSAGMQWSVPDLLPRGIAGRRQLQMLEEQQGGGRCSDLL
jgi:hypothetical protein